MAAATRPPRNGFVALARRVYNPLGFAKGYNFTLWFIFGGALAGFALSRFMYLNIDGIYCSPNRSSSGNSALPGECYYYGQKGRHERVGILIHLAGILPAGLLAVTQFVPAIRHHFLIVHRITGYVTLLLAVVGTAGLFLVARNAFGGAFDMQLLTGLISIGFLVALAIAYYNIKRLQIEQHRAWMIRAWTWVSASLLVKRRPSLVTIGL